MPLWGSAPPPTSGCVFLKPLKFFSKSAPGPLPITLVKSMNNELCENQIPTIDKLVNVCASLCNLSTGIVYSEK